PLKKTCEDYRSGQVNPATPTATATPNPALTATQLKTVKNAAIAAGRYFPVGSCPTELSQLSGNPTYVEDPCGLSYSDDVAHSAASPGFLVLRDGTFELNGNALFYGTVYAVNVLNLVIVPVVGIHGTAQLVGTLVVDGKGGVAIGSSGGKTEEAENFVYNPT